MRIRDEKKILIRDPEWEKILIRDKHPGSATLRVIRRNSATWANTVRVRYMMVGAFPWSQRCRKWGRGTGGCPAQRGCSRASSPRPPCLQGLNRPSVIIRVIDSLPCLQGLNRLSVIIRVISSVPDASHFDTNSDPWIVRLITYADLDPSFFGSGLQCQVFFCLFLNVGNVH